MPLITGHPHDLPRDGRLVRSTDTDGNRPGAATNDLTWSALPATTRAYLLAVMTGGASTLVAFFPDSFPQPLLFATLIVLACVTSVWKVNLPIALASGSTLSMSYAANLMALLLLGPSHAVVVAVAGAWTQCTYKVKRRYPIYRTVFSAAAEAITMVATGLAYLALGGGLRPIASLDLAGPVVGAITTYFLVNTGLVAGAIALSTGRRFGTVWRDDFLWSAASFMVAGTAGAIAAIVVARGGHWTAVLMLAPVHLTYATYKVFVGRLDDQRRHVAETERLHQQAIEALEQTRRAERELGEEKERLATALADMTRLEQQLVELLEREQAARASAEQASQLKDEFLAIVSHELRTPLNAVLGWAEMLRRGRIAEPQRGAAINTIYRSAKRQAQLIDDLLDVARIMSGKLRLEHTVVDLRDVVRDALQAVQPTVAAKRLNVAIDADPGLGLLYADSSRLQQVASNLLSNAVKFTPEGGSVSVGLRESGGQVQMVVSDTGEGIAADFLPSVFEAFRQADASTTRVQGGLGLGLAIVKHLVEAHGGTIQVQSDGPGRGAVFTVRLPVSIGFAEAPLPPAPVHAGAVQVDTSLDGISVLVVDDDQESREVVAAHLRERQALVLTAASAAQAFDMLQHERVDVLVADIAMPGEDGYSLLRRLRALKPAPAATIPAAALTAFARDDDRRQALQAGFQLHMAKPVEAHSLVAAVSQLFFTRSGRTGQSAPSSRLPLH
jgi:signal transduction histidine kinase/ActR/RegA family two-component response regulator